MKTPRTHRTSRRTVEGDEVILVDEGGRPIGTADRTTVHTRDTPLHLAFSTYLFNARGEVLLTRRALGKKTWPGVWTNSCCGHPRPGESIEDAARRRVRQELGLHIGPLVPLLPDFRYRATDASGIVENEICPVFAAFVPDDEPSPDPDEVAEWAWIGWENLSSAIAATPQVYSPWMRVQVPQIATNPADLQGAVRQEPVTPDVVVADVDALLTAEMAALTSEWERYAGRFALDVLDADLPAWLGSLLIGEGKRLRTQMAHLGFLAAGGIQNSARYHHLVRIAAALETLHLFALIHDDVMDESDVRRGRPSAHVTAADRHRLTDGSGDPEVFGRNLAILLGDLAHMLSDRLVDGLPRVLREVWYALSVELIAGQRADLTGAAAGRRDRAHAEHVARAKSGRYTVTRPLQLGALAAGAAPDVVAALMRCGDHLGRAFALRDDYLGVWGDPAITGKPAGDDLLEAKPTVLISVATERLTGSDAELLARVGTGDFTAADVAALAEAMRRAGVAEAVDDLIAAAVRDALATLDDEQLDGSGVSGLRAAAETVAWRTA